MIVLSIGLHGCGLVETRFHDDGDDDDDDDDDIRVYLLFRYLWFIARKGMIRLERDARCCLNICIVFSGTLRGNYFSAF